MVNDKFCLQEKEELKKEQVNKKYEGYKLKEDVLILYKRRLYVPNNEVLKKIVMNELHKLPYSTHFDY